MDKSQFNGGIYLVDFEFNQPGGKNGNKPDPVCMVVRDWSTGATKRYWQDELRKMPRAPYPTGAGALTVAFYASAEMDCFHELGWVAPQNVLDIYAEFRCHTNGLILANGKGLLGALLYFGLPTIGGEQKDVMRDLILKGGPWSSAEELAILDYCETDVVGLANLLSAMWEKIDLPRALLRGRYVKAVSCIQMIGVPLDIDIFEKLTPQWASIKDQLIAEIDLDYGVYVEGTFKIELFEAYLAANDIPWPRLPTGRLDLKDETFRQMSKCYLQVSAIRELRSSLSALRLAKLQVGDDGRNRCMLSPFSSRTGRNQPSNAQFIFGPSVWLRGLIRPAPGWALAYVDWSQQEFGIAAALSGDPNMIAAYLSGDPYIAFAIQAGAAPPGATKQTHEAIRNQFKACVLAVQYGMGEERFATDIGQPIERARQLLTLHRITYRRFWEWSDSAVDQAVLGGQLWACFGWKIQVSGKINDRSLRNFPMQANGAEMLRIACFLLADQGIRVCAPVHDALLIEAPIGEIEDTVAKTQAIMREASAAVLDGFELCSEAKIIRYPDRYMDPRGIKMWDTVMRLIGGPETV